MSLHTFPHRMLKTKCISGTRATIFYSSEMYPSRISVPFARSLKCHSQTSGALGRVPLPVTGAMSTGAFTAVIDTLVDPLCEVYVVLGKDWIDLFASKNVLPHLELPPIYYSGESVSMIMKPFTWTSAVLSPFLLPDRFAPPSGSSSQISPINCAYFLFFLAM